MDSLGKKNVILTLFDSMQLLPQKYILKVLFSHSHSVISCKMHIVLPGRQACRGLRSSCLVQRRLTWLAGASKDFASVKKFKTALAEICTSSVRSVSCRSVCETARLRDLIFTEIQCSSRLLTVDLHRLQYSCEKCVNSSYILSVKHPLLETER